MAKEVLSIPLAGTSPGTSRALRVVRYRSAGLGPKAYLQASLHADEVPGMLVLHHLTRLLDQADGAGAVLGEIVVVPAANPMGLDQVVGAVHAGRHELASGINFNRGWPDFTDSAAERLGDTLGPDSVANVALVRAALRASVAAWQPTGALQGLRRTLLGLAIDADVALDLHADLEALLHLYVSTASWPDAADLAAEIGSRATLLALDSGGASFDEALSLPWARLRERFGPAKPVPQACLSATVELRGRAEVADELAEADARAILRFLARRGIVAMDPGPLPALAGPVVPLEAVDMVRAPAAGLVAYRRRIGDRLEAGAVIADLVDPCAEDPSRARAPIATCTDGLLLSVRDHKLVRPGETVAKVVGSRPLPGRTGYLLED